MIQDVEFVNDELPSGLADLQFGFHPSPTVASSQSTPQQQKQQHQQTPVQHEQLQQIEMQQIKQAMLQEQAAKLREPSLSYVSTSMVEYQSNDTRQQQQQQAPQQPQQQQQHPSLQPQQQQAPQQQHPSLQQQQHQMYTAAAQFPNFAFPYMYSPVAANLRDVEQYTTLASFPTAYLNGMGTINPMEQMPMGAMIPPSLAQSAGQPQQNIHQSQQSAQQQSTQPQHRQSISENKYQNSGNFFNF